MFKMNKAKQLFEVFSPVFHIFTVEIFFAHQLAINMHILYYNFPIVDLSTFIIPLF